MRALALVVLASAAALADTVVLKDGRILEGKASRAEGASAVRIGGKSLRLDDVFLWEDAEGVARNEPSLGRHVKGLAELAGRDVLAQAKEQLPRAIEAKAPEAARKLLERAERAGLEAAQADAWSSKIDALGDADGTFEIPPGSVLVDLLVDRARRSRKAGQEHRALELLRVALSRDGEHAAGLAFLEELAPARWFGSREKKDYARNWLDWKLEVLPGRVRTLKRRHPDMERALALWDRKDLRGLETSEIVFVTPMKTAGPVGMCLRLSRLTCQTLDRMFAVEEPARDDFLPLIVYFYENKAEYVKLSGRGVGQRPNAALGFSAGHYKHTENVSRFFWPSRPGGERSVAETFVHELTHHWIERRNPRWHARDLASTADRVETPGFWVVEGTAVFMQEGRFDLERGLCSHFSPHSFSLDAVAALAAEKESRLIPWKRFYGLSQRDFQVELMRNASKVHATAKCKWTIRPIPMSEVVLFYRQAGATCQFLYWGEGGKYRERLYDYVTAFYTSKEDQTSVETAFGLTPEELGKKVEDFSASVMKGWRPKGS